MILRGANDYMLDEMERALHDALSIVKRTLESNTVICYVLFLFQFLPTSSSRYHFISDTFKFSIDKWAIGIGNKNQKLIFVMSQFSNIYH